MSEIECYAITVTGRVQGVSFRSNAREAALRLGLAGFARNEPDGSVYIEAEGSKKALSNFLQWCRQGPMHAAVDNVSFNQKQPAGYQNFMTF